MCEGVMLFTECRGIGGMPDRIRVEDKSLLNCQQVDVNQLMPIKYHWAFEHYLNGCANHWMPTEVSMNKDVEIWRGDKLTEDERLVLMRNLGFFATAESLVGNNLVLAIFRYITNAEVRLYLLRQAFEEAIHTHTFLYVVDTLQLDEGEVFNTYREIPSVAQKDEFVMRHTSGLMGGLDTTKRDGVECLLRNLIAFYVIMEGIFFYAGFVMVLSLHRRNLMTGIGEQFQYILRDEGTHLAFGCDLINGIKTENPSIWSQSLQDEVVKDVMESVELEIAYAQDCLPRGILGLNAGVFRDYVQFVVDRRLERIGLSARYGSRNPFTWMSETMDLSKEKNFFETRVIDYQSSSLDWD